MEAAELRTLAEVEDRHWWYKERRSLLARELRRLGTPGLALDIGAAGGGNTRVLRAHGWRPMALEYAPTAAQIARERGIDVVRADARELPLRTGSLDLVTAFDVLEHIEEDYLVAAEITRVLRPGGTALIAVPADMALWSAHDEAVVGTDGQLHTPVGRIEPRDLAHDRGRAFQSLDLADVVRQSV